MTSPPPAITTHSLRKSFGSTVALDGLDLHVPSGTVFALLGSNGAGKSTTIRILTTLLPFDSGTVEVTGLPLPAGPGISANASHSPARTRRSTTFSPAPRTYVWPATSLIYPAQRSPVVFVNSSHASTWGMSSIGAQAPTPGAPPDDSTSR